MSDIGYVVAVRMAALTFTMGATIEGGYSSRSDDTGNYDSNGKLIGSNHGISAEIAEDWLAKNQPFTVLTAGWMKALSLATAQQIAIDELWNDVNFDLVAVSLDPGIAIQGFDHHFNRGGRHGIDLIQKVLGYVPTTGHADFKTGDLYASADLGLIAKQITPGKDKTAAKAQAALNAGLLLDGDIGPVTLKAAAANPHGRAILILHAVRDAQYADYATLAAASKNPGWFTRVDARLKAALAVTLNPPT